MSSHPIANSFTSFIGRRHLASGSLQQVALAVRSVRERNMPEPLLIFDNSSGRSIDIDTRGSEDQVLARLGFAGSRAGDKPDTEVEAQENSTGRRSRGRPKLGVVSREVTLLPRHWAWLADQPGGASVALRKLVEQARRESVEKDSRRAANERAYNFMSAMAGDLEGFEEGIRALFAGDRDKFEAQIDNWPEDIRQHACWLAFGRLRVRS